MAYDFVSFTTDYGLADGFPAACEGVISRIAPAVRVIHVSHLIPAQDVRRGAAVLAQTVPSLPPAVHLAVVDPGVGTSRRGVAIVTERGVFVGPDNGLLVPAASLFGITAVHELTGLPAAATFHGRDLFAPAAARIAAGAVPDGPAIDPATLVRLPDPITMAMPGKLITEVLGVDTFGNVQLAATAVDLAMTGAAAGWRAHAQIGDRSLEAVVGRTFADTAPGTAVLLIDSAGYVAIAVNGGSAAHDLHPATGVSATVLVARG
ncbi:SAM hydrolase/SAM-dependent halogenase family protein [Actinokineospora sp. HUAS TT18]|uniref:SAM hydrolase/SAM-dependent halogenase family protein n=1 Tax=Actinokineospora sp. HUAS TT18 TaxID=3447451 RepID=UPI003F5226C2